MKGSDTIIEFLNEALTAELTAVNQYFAHAKMLENWGYEYLGAKTKEESIDEMRDAEKVIDRILFLDGVPNYQRLDPVRVGETVKEQIELALETEKAAIARYNRGVALATAENDNGTKTILEQLLLGEESHADWLEGQLDLIKQMGESHYLSLQVRN